MESPHDFFVAHWDHEPDWTISCRICDTNLSERFVRFMGRGAPRERAGVRGTEVHLPDHRVIKPAGPPTG